MNSVQQLLELPGVLPGIETALAPRGGQRGWVTVDGRSHALRATTVHIRPWLKDPGAPARYRLDGQRGFALSTVPSSYGVVFVARPDGVMEPIAYEALADVIEHGGRHLVVRDAGNDVLYSAGDGRWLDLPAARPATGARLSLEVHGARSLRLESTLPCGLAVESSAPQDVIHIRLPARSGFRAVDQRFQFSRVDGRPLGRGKVVLDFAADGTTDRLLVRTDGFIGQVAVEDMPAPQARSGRFSSHLPVRLHVLYDRTTISLEHWESAFLAVTQERMEVTQKGGRFDAEALPPPPAPDDLELKAMAWNLSLRQALGAALVHRLPELHPDVRVELWWFADTAQAGVAEPEGVPKAAAPWGRAGECAPEHLADRLAGSVFGYATGMDLFDAVDQLLAEVAGATHFARDEQHAILIVGDSPPPPADEHDPLWRSLLEHPLRTNARRSPLFRRHLQDLAGRQVPVGWLFLRSSAPPPGRPSQLRLYPQFQTLRENTLVALQRLPGLVVQSCDGAGDFDRALGELFRRLPDRPEPFSTLDLEASS